MPDSATEIGDVLIACALHPGDITNETIQEVLKENLDTSTLLCRHMLHPISQHMKTMPLNQIRMKLWEKHSRPCLYRRSNTLVVNIPPAKNTLPQEEKFTDFVEISPDTTPPLTSKHVVQVRRVNSSHPYSSSMKCYSKEFFVGVCIESGADESVVAMDQAYAFCNRFDTIFKLSSSSLVFRFGDGSQEKRIPLDPHTDS